MSPDCKVCENQKWKDHYMMAQQRFDKVLIRLTIAFVLIFTVMVICIFVLVCTVIRTQKFIDGFEYVEETEIQIEQDCSGQNVVMLPDGKEVKLMGQKYTEKKKRYWRKKTTRATQSTSTNESLWQKIKRIFTKK